MRTGIMWCPEDNVEEKVKELEVIKSLGYDCIDFQSFCHTENVFFDTPSEMERRLRLVKATADSLGLVVSQTHGPWRCPPFDRTDEEKAERFEKMVRSLYGTAMLGCRDLVIHPIMPFGCDREPDTEAFIEQNLEFFGRLVEEAKKADVVIDFENMPFPALSLSTPAQILDFVKKIDSPYFRVCLDTGHCAVMKCDAGDAVRMTGKEYLRVLHVHDNNGVSDYHWLPKTGVIDWDGFTSALHEIGFEGVFSLETDVAKKDLSDAEYMEKRKQLASLAKRLAS